MASIATLGSSDRYNKSADKKPVAVNYVTPSSVLDDRQYAREYRSTAWQDTVSDMQAAGINPLFAVTQGATPVTVGSQATQSETARQDRETQNEISKRNQATSLISSAMSMLGGLGGSLIGKLIPTNVKMSHTNR